MTDQEDEVKVDMKIRLRLITAKFTAGRWRRPWLLNYMVSARIAGFWVPSLFDFVTISNGF
jgi:hypothetical protein